MAEETSFSVSDAVQYMSGEENQSSLGFHSTESAEELTPFYSSRTIHVGGENIMNAMDKLNQFCQVHEYSLKFDYKRKENPIMWNCVLHVYSENTPKSYYKVCGEWSMSKKEAQHVAAERFVNLKLKQESAKNSKKATAAAVKENDASVPFAIHCTFEKANQIRALNGVSPLSDRKEWNRQLQLAQAEFISRILFAEDGDE